MENLQAGDLTIQVFEGDDPPTVRLDWLGMSNERQPETILGPFLETALDGAAKGSRLLELHFERIERFNSSTILSIIKLIQEARKRGVRMSIAYDPTRKWQRLSFDALRIFDKKDGLFEIQAMEHV